MNSSYTQQSKVIQQAVQHVSESISIVINSVLIYLIIKKSPSKLGPYKYLMTFISVFEMLYSVTDFLVSPIFYSYGPALIVIVNLNESFFGKAVSYILLCVYSGFFGTSMAIFGIHFIYRFLVASGHPLLGTFYTWKIVLWLSFPIFYGIIWGLGSYFPCAPTEYTNEFVKQDVMDNYGLSLNELIYFGLHFYGRNKNGELFIVYEQVIGVLVNCFIISSSIFTAVFFGVKTYQKINDLASHMSAKNKSLQTELFYALVVQTMIPIVLMHIPVTIIYSFAFMGHGMGTICGIASITISMYPAFDPLPTIVIIKNYRNAVLNLFCCRAKVVPSAAVSHQLENQNDINCPQNS